MKRKNIILIISIIAILAFITSVSYAFFSARITKINETKTKVQTNTLGLEFNGTKEIEYNSMIPGDKFTKTFTVKNISNRAVTFNIYLENIINEFDDFLVYKLDDNKGHVIEETVFPITNPNKTNIKTDISIASGETITYTMTIEYKYSETVDQSSTKGHRLQATLGIDTALTYTVTFDPNGGTTPVASKQVAVGNTYGDLPTPTREGYTFKGWHGKNLFDENNPNIVLLDYGASVNDNKIYFDASKTLNNKGNAIQVQKRTNSYGFVGNIFTTYNAEKVSLKITKDNSFDNIYIKLNTSLRDSGIYVNNIFENGKNYTISFSIDNIIPDEAKAIISDIQIEEGSTATAYEPYYITPTTEVVQPYNHTLTAIWEAN